MDPQDVMAAMMAFQRQAGERLAACKQDLASRGLGFDDDDRAAIEASAAAHPFPAGYDPDAPPSEEDVAASQRVAAQAMAAEYPKDGFLPDDPRIAPIEGIDLPLFAIAARAIGWSEEPAHVARVLGKLGIDPSTWGHVSTTWAKRVSDDVVLAAYYGQLFNQA